MINFLDSIKSKFLYRQPIYIPGYKYTPWKKWIFICIGILLLLILIWFFFLNNKQSNYFSYYQVDHVIDGDTIAITINGRIEDVRLIGIDTPETKDPRKNLQCYGQEATEKMQQYVQGKRVLLKSDSSQDDKDKYNRLLRYVFLENGQNVALEMIRQGYGREYTYNIPYKYQTEFKNAELHAKSLSIGLWSADTCSGGTVILNPSESTAPTNIRPSENVDRTTPTIDSSCNNNYSPCVPQSSTDLDCADIGFSVQVIGVDVYRLDRDKDGYGCESY